MHPFGSICECLCAHARTLPCSHGTAWHANTLHMSFQSDPSVFDPPTEEGRRASRGISQANTKGYRTHSTLNIKDSGNCSTLLSGSCGTAGHLIHLTLWMRENGSPVMGNHLEQMSRRRIFVNYFTSVVRRVIACQKWPLLLKRMDPAAASDGSLSSCNLWYVQYVCLITRCSLIEAERQLIALKSFSRRLFQFHGMEPQLTFKG